MAEHGVDGVFLQRFASHCAEGKEDLRRMRDEITLRVREAAEKEGRVFSIMLVVGKRLHVVLADPGIGMM